MEELPIDLVNDIVSGDQLHYIMRMLLYIWGTGTSTFTKLPLNKLKQLSSLNEKSHQAITRDFHRRGACLERLRLWKIEDLRTFLLYLSPVVLKDVLPTNVYQHFLELFCASRICSVEHFAPMLNTADILFKMFLTGYIEIYGRDSITNKIHSLCHLVADVKRTGPLHTFSGHAFRNILLIIKTMLRYSPLPETAKKIAGLECEVTATGIFPRVTDLFEMNQYKTVELIDGLTLSSDQSNKWFLTCDNDVIQMLYASCHNNRIFIYGSKITALEDFFDSPIKSSVINVYVTNGFVDEPKMWEVTNVKSKLAAVEYGRRFVLLPIVHPVY